MPLSACCCEHPVTRSSLLWMMKLSLKVAQSYYFKSLFPSFSLIEMATGVCCCPSFFLADEAAATRLYWSLAFIIFYDMLIICARHEDDIQHIGTFQLDVHTGYKGLRLHRYIMPLSGGHLSRSLREKAYNRTRRERESRKRALSQKI